MSHDEAVKTLEKILPKVRAECDHVRRSCEDIGCWGKPLEDAIRVVLAENERLLAALERMANDGCGCVTPYRSTCLTEYPKDQEQWCWSCMAVNALQGEEGK